MNTPEHQKIEFPRIRNGVPTPPAGPLLLGRKESAALTGISRASWDRLSSAGKNPMPLKLGGRVLWRRSDLDRWVALGLPDRKTFAAIAEK